MTAVRGSATLRARRTGRGRLIAAALGIVAAGVVSSSAAAPATQPVVPKGGYWLSVELLGPRGAQVATTEELSLGSNVSQRVPIGGSFPPGELVGHVDSIQDAMTWVAKHAFEDAPPGASETSGAVHEGAAPLPGGGVLTDHRVLLLSLIVSGATEDGGTRGIRWPMNQGEVLPDGLGWKPAALLPVVAPLFAAPDDQMPRSAERYAMVERSGGLYVVGTIDRCRGEGSDRRCLRWARVIARDGDRFRGGYLPNHQVALTAGWRRAGDFALPRAQLIASHIAGGHAHFLLIVRAQDNELHRVTVSAPLVGGGFPHATLRVTPTSAIVEIDGQAPLSLSIEPGMDRYERPER